MIKLGYTFLFVLTCLVISCSDSESCLTRIDTTIPKECGKYTGEVIRDTVFTFEHYGTDSQFVDTFHHRFLKRKDTWTFLDEIKVMEYLVEYFPEIHRDTAYAYNPQTKKDELLYLRFQKGMIYAKKGVPDSTEVIYYWE